MHLMRRKKKSHTLFRMFSGVDDSLKCLFLLLYEEERDLHFKGEKNPFLLLSPPPRYFMHQENYLYYSRMITLTSPAKMHLHRK